MDRQDITVYYSSLDGYRLTRRYRTLNGARRFARKWGGRHPDIGGSYAVTADGVGKVSVSGCSLAELFPEA